MDTSKLYTLSKLPHNNSEEKSDMCWIKKYTRSKNSYLISWIFNKDKWGEKNGSKRNSRKT